MPVLVDEDTWREEVERFNPQNQFMNELYGPAALQASAKLVRAALAPAGMGRTVIAIDGRGGSGKSTLAARLAAQFDAAPIIHTDDFANWENPLDWWPRLWEQVLLPLSEGGPAHYQRWDWDLQQLAEWHDVKPGGYLFLEGMSASRREFRPYLAGSIWVSTLKEECLRRGLERDGAETLEEWREWQAAEDEYIGRDHPDAFADLVVSGENGEVWTGPTRPDKAQPGETG